MKWPGILYATDIRSRVKSIRFTHKDPDNSDSLCDYNKLQKEHIWGAINTFLFRKYHLLSQVILPYLIHSIERRLNVGFQ